MTEHAYYVNEYWIWIVDFFSAPSFLGLCSDNCSDPLTTEITSVYFFCIFLFCFFKTLLCNSLWKCLCTLTNFYFSLFLMCVFHKNPCSLFCFSFHRHTLISHGGVTFEASSECFCASTPQTNEQTNERTTSSLKLKSPAQKPDLRTRSLHFCSEVCDFRDRKQPRCTY